MTDISLNNDSESFSNLEERWKTYKPSELAENTGIAESTVRKYAKILENYQYSFKKDTSGHRIYTDKEVTLFKEIIDIRTKTGIGIEQAVSVALLQQNKNARSTQGVRSYVNNDILNIYSDMRKQLAMIQKDSETKLDALQTKLEMLQKDRITLAITQRRVERKLKKEAAGKWEGLSEEERYMVIGRWPFKQKIEDTNKKNSFIQSYVDDHFEKELLSEYSDTNHIIPAIKGDSFKGK